MKELSIEEKARRYDEAKYIMKGYLESGNAGVIAENTIKKAFPELSESEDEIVIAALKSGINGLLKKEYHLKGIGGISFDRIIDWLEKQAQKPVDKSKIKPKFKTGDRVIGVISGMPYFITGVCDDHYNTESGCIIMFCSQDNFELYEQKPWSEEDEKAINDIMWIIETYRKNGFNKTHIQIADSSENWLKSLKDRVQPKRVILEKLEEWLDEYVSSLADVDTASLIYSFKNYLDGKLPKSIRPQPKQEWSEEDERLFQIIIDILDRENHLGNLSHTDLIACVRKLKSLRPRSQWKPSDEQMIALQEAMNIVGILTLTGSKINSLYQDLKKLK